jgi:endonuclease-3
MKSSRNFASVSSILDAFCAKPKIPLDHKDPYTLLIAVLLSAQCTDERVNKVTPLLFSKADNPQKMSELSISEIEPIIRPCGLSNRKATSISLLSKILLQDYCGAVPESFEQLESLPGVGHKTASVVMVQAFGHPAFPVDTHIMRSARRWGLSKSKTVSGVEKDLKKIFPKEEWGLRHLQIILFSRVHCKARSHDPKICPMCSNLNGK